ncbi:MAG: ABC transporter ATP-binding protein [Clostridiales bacterium]|mgnify:CR=1 FL=1|jgi:NitT/TauT family transport system ATP-binding protein|nr:ABC transporter ATP-binding protein [Clostridiales bacterium]
MDIRVDKICKSFNGKKVIDSFSMYIPEGSITCLMGASGVGKTTLANIIMGLVQPDRGEIIGLSDKRIAAVFQEDRLIEHWDASRNILLVSKKGVNEVEVEKHLSEVGLADCKAKPARELSGGMRRRLAIVRAMLSDYDLLIMDEPFKGLDDELKKQVIAYVRSNLKGRTLLVITHDRKEAEMLEARIVEMA